MDDYRLPDKEILALKRFHKTLKVKREADKVKAVYSVVGKIGTVIPFGGEDTCYFGQRTVLSSQGSS